MTSAGRDRMTRLAGDEEAGDRGIAPAGRREPRTRESIFVGHLFQDSFGLARYSLRQDLHDHALSSQGGAAPAQVLVPEKSRERRTRIRPLPGWSPGGTAGLVFIAGHDGTYIQSAGGLGLLTPVRAMTDRRP